MTTRKRELPLRLGYACHFRCRTRSLLIEFQLQNLLEIQSVSFI